MSDEVSTTPRSRRSTAISSTDQRQSAILNRRISSLYTATTEVCAVFEIGSRMLRAGLSGEYAPRCVLPLPRSSILPCPEEDKRLSSEPYDLLSNEFLGEFEDRIDKVAREAINRYLYLPLKGKRVILVESYYLSIRVKRSIARVFFTYYQPREISFLPASVCSLFALGSSSGIVLNFGTDESTVVPVFDSRPLINLARSTGLGHSAMVHRAKFLLQHHSNPSLDNIITSDIEDFLTRALVCLPRSPMVPDISDFLLDQDLQTTYDIEEHKRSQFEWVRPSTKEKHNLPTWLRYAITEILFEARGIYCDSAYTSITNCILSARKAAGLDLHGALDHLCITGGLCQIPGLQKRIQAETGLKILDNPFASDLAWTGASLATSMKVEGQTLNIHTFTGSSKMPDWSQRPR